MNDVLARKDTFVSHNARLIYQLPSTGLHQLNIYNLEATACYSNRVILLLEMLAYIGDSRYARSKQPLTILSYDIVNPVEKLSDPCVYSGTAIGAYLWSPRRKSNYSKIPVWLLDNEWSSRIALKLTIMPCINLMSSIVSCFRRVNRLSIRSPFCPWL